MAFLAENTRALVESTFASTGVVRDHTPAEVDAFMAWLSARRPLHAAITLWGRGIGCLTAMEKAVR